MKLLDYGEDDKYLITPYDDPTDTSRLVSQRFANAQAYADEARETALALLDELAEAVGEIIWSIPDWVPVDDAGLSGINPIDPGEITVDPISMPAVDFEGTIPERDDPVITTDPPPEPSYSSPDINIPDPPDDEFPIFDTDPPSITDPDIPNKPEVTVPALPDIPDVVIPSPPDYNIPDFEGEVPVTDLTPPEPVFVWNELEYDSDLKTAITTRLLAEIVAGGTGLSEEWESAFLARMQVKLDEEHEAAYQEAYNRFAQRGFIMPPGALAGQMLELQNRVLQNQENLLNDIIVKQEEVAHEYGKFVVDRSVQWEKDLMENTNVFQQRQFEAAKFSVEAALIVYRAKVEAYKAELEAYKVLAQVFTAKIQAEIAKAELYKAQIEGVKATVDVQRARIAAYEAQIKGINAVVDLYTAEMEGAKVKAEVDRTRVEGYKALVEAYAARVNAITAKYNAYQAQIAGEEAKAKVYLAEVQGYNAEVNAYRSKAEVDIARAEAQLKIIMADIDIFRGYVDKYRADTQWALASVEADVKIEELDVTVYEAQVRRYQSQTDAAVRAYLGRVEEAKAKYFALVEEAKLEISEAVELNKITYEKIRASAQVAAALANSALAGVSANAAISWREARSDSTSATVSQLHQNIEYGGNQTINSYITYKDQ
jgi:hypothetical protein